MPAAPALPPEALAVLQRVFGFPGLRPGQPEVVAALLAGADVLAVMPTGAGKSLCYQLPAIVRRRLTVVVSPLIALMRDQVGQLVARGVSAGALHSGNTEAEGAAVGAALAARTLRLLYVSPERLRQPGTLERLRAAGVDRLAIDEAHCVSQWGHDFRPDYMDLQAAASALGDPPVVAVTASADPATRDEIVARLFRREPQVMVRSFARTNLSVGFARKDDPTRQVAAFVARHKGESGIVYCASRKGVERLAASLAESGTSALPYHAGLEPSLRHANQDAFLRERGIVVVATVAFGMGIDKPDVRYVCHADLPGSVEGYYQEIGRAGRDGLPAETLTFWGEGDVRLRERQIAMGDAPAARKTAERARLGALLALCETPRCRWQTLLAAFGEASEPCGTCDICAGRHRRFNGVVAAQKAMSALLRTSGRFFPNHLANILVGKATDAVARHGHDALPTFGVGREFDAAQWRSIFRQIEAAGLIATDPEESSHWHVTEDGRQVLTGAAALDLLAAPEPVRERGRRNGATPGAADDTLTTDEAGLFAALKANRLVLARERKLPAYVVLPDRSLREIARTRPRDAEALQKLHGIGAAKAANYGASFLAVVRDYAERG